MTNYRSKQNLVAFANEFSRYFPQRLKNTKLISKSNENGTIEITFYEEDSSYIKNVVDAIKNDSESLSIAILARTNDEVLQIYSILGDKGIKARYITSKDGFELGSLVELRDFLRFWEKSSFDEAMQILEDRYKQSKNYPLACEVINRFYDEYADEIEKSPRHFQALFKEYLEEIEFDEFEQSRSRVIVSTMHKAKGKEFDTVFVCTEDNLIRNEYDARLLYVAITRAKERLYIHTKDRYFKRFENFADRVNYYKEKIEDNLKIVFLMGLGDIALANEYAQRGIQKFLPQAGEKIAITQKQDNIFELKKNGWCVGVLAKAFGETKGERVSTKIIQMQQKGYKLVNEAEIEYIVEWCDKIDKRIYQEVLCKIVMKKEVEHE